MKRLAPLAAKDIFGKWMYDANLRSETLDSAVIQCDGTAAIRLIVELPLKACWQPFPRISKEPLYFSSIKMMLQLHYVFPQLYLGSD